MNKLFRVIKKRGIKKTVSIGVKLYATGLLNRHFWQNKIKNLKSKVKNKRVIIFTCTAEWFSSYQRTQQLASEYAKQKDTVVIYVSRLGHFDQYVNTKDIKEDIILYSFRHYKKLNDILTEANEVILYVTNLFNYEINMSLKHNKLVYEYIDELELFFENVDEARKLHIDILKKANVSVATASKLYEEIKPLAKKAILSPNAGDYEFFNNNINAHISSDIRGHVDKYDRVIGYYGMLADWFDYDLIKNVAETKKNWLWILVGDKYDESFHSSGLEKLDNVIITGFRPYKTLPNYVAACDIMTIPFKVNNITLSTSPVKLFEYMASEKPILACNIPECKKYKSVNIYENYLDFIDKVDFILNEENNYEYKKLLNKEAKENTWEKRAEDILNMLYKGKEE